MRGHSAVPDTNYAHRLVSAGGRRYEYDANGNVVLEDDASAPKAQTSITSSNENDEQSPAYGDFEINGDTAVYHKITKEAEDVYSTDYGWGLFKDEDKGGGASATRYRRTYTWDENNRLISSVDANCSTAYVYGHDGQRSSKYTHNSETLYFSKMWTLHTDSGNNIYGGQTAKNIYLGDTRIVTKLNSGSDPTYAHKVSANPECYLQAIIQRKREWGFSTVFLAENAMICIKILAHIKAKKRAHCKFEKLFDRLNQHLRIDLWLKKLHPLKKIKFLAFVNFLKI